MGLGEKQVCKATETSWKPMENGFGEPVDMSPYVIVNEYPDPG